MSLKLLEVTEDLGMWWVVSLIIPVIIIIMFFGMYICTYVCIWRPKVDVWYL